MCCARDIGGTFLLRDEVQSPDRGDRGEIVHQRRSRARRRNRVREHHHQRPSTVFASQTNQKAQPILHMSGEHSVVAKGQHHDIRGRGVAGGRDTRRGLIELVEAEGSGFAAEVGSHMLDEHFGIASAGVLVEHHANL